MVEIIGCRLFPEVGGKGKPTPGRKFREKPPAAPPADAGQAASPAPSKTVPSIPKALTPADIEFFVEKSADKYPGYVPVWSPMLDLRNSWTWKGDFSTGHNEK